MKANYHKENDMETCIISVMKIKITMTSQEKMVKKDDKGRSYLRCKVKYEINNAFDYFYTEADIIDFLKNNVNLGKTGFVYALYCLISKAFYHKELNIKLNSNIEKLRNFLKKKKILDGNAGIAIEENIIEICERAYDYLIYECKLTEADLAFLPEVLLEYLNTELNYFI